jgi:hypothetical protein
MFRPFIVLALLSLLPVSALRAQETKPTQIVEAAGGFAYTVPQGWRTGNLQQVKYKIAYTTPVKGFAPNVNVVDESFKGSIQEYVQRNVAALEKQFSQFKNLGQSAFKTTSGLNGVKLVSEAEQQGNKLRQVFFFFPGKGDKKFVITFSALAEEGKKYDAKVEKSLKTFVLK